jgi:hypothetical protein
MSKMKFKGNKTSNDGAKAPQTNAERQAAYRARKAADKLQEVRGIFATEESALKIRQFAESLKT